MKLRYILTAGALKIILPAVILLILTSWLLGNWYYARLLADARSEVETETVPVGNALTTALNQRIALLEGLVAYAHSHPSEDMLRDSFVPFASGLVSASQGVRAIQIYSPDQPVLVYPTAGNEATLGRTLDDLINDERPNVRADVQRAIQTGKVTLSDPYELRQGGLGLVIRQAVFNNDQFWGIAVVVVDLPPLFSEAGIPTDSPDLEISLRDQNGTMFFGQASLFDRQPVIYSIDLPEGSMQMGALPEGDWAARVQPAWRQFIWLMVLIVGLIFILILMMASTQQYLQHTVKERTSQLGRELQRHQQALEALKTSENKFRSLAETAEDVILIHDLQGNVSYINRSGIQIIGLSEQEVAAGFNLLDFIPQKYHPMLAGYASERRDNLGGARLYELEIINRDGQLIPVEVSSSAIIQSGKVIGLVVLARDITARNKAQQELKIALIKYQTLFDTLPAGVTVTDPKGEIIEINLAAERILGIPGKAPDGRTAMRDVRRFIRLDGSPLPVEELARNRALRDNKPVENVEMGIVKSPEVTTWISVNAAPIPLENFGVVVTYADITHRIQAEKERIRAAEILRESEERFRTLYEQAPLGYQSLDDNGNIVDVNQAWLEMFDYKSEEVLGKWFGDFLPENEKTLFRQRFPVFKARGRIQGAEFHMLRKDGSQILISIDGRIGKTITGEFKQTHCILHDITERKLAEEKIHQLNTRLEQRVAERTTELEISNRELEAFAYSVSHDLRTPLRAIDGFSRIIQEDYAGKLDQEADRLIEIIRRSTKKMDELITDLLSLSRVSSSGLAYAQIAMTEMAGAVYHELASPEVLESFSFSLQPLPTCSADPTLIRQVWSNLLSNAIKYTMPKEERSIEVGYTVKEGVGAYYVKDSGVGFNPEYANKLFGPFQRLHRAEQFEGTGVGLAIVQRIIQRHHGRVWGESVVGQGAVFYFHLPEQVEGPPKMPIDAAI